MTVGTYRKKPAVVHAVQYDGVPENANQVVNWIIENGGTARYQTSWISRDGSTIDNVIVIDSIDGTQIAGPEWWVINDPENGFATVKNDIFAATYEVVESTNGGMGRIVE